MSVAALTDINVLRRLSVNEMIRVCTTNRTTKERCQTDPLISGLFMDKLRDNLLHYVELHNYGGGRYSLRITIPDPRNSNMSIASFTVYYKDPQDIENNIDEIYRDVADEGLWTVDIGSYSYNRESNNRHLLALEKDYDFVSMYIQPSLLVEILNRLLDLDEYVQERLFVQMDGIIIAVNDDEVLSLFGETFFEDVWVKLMY
jgi:hypothetical protein